MKFAGNANASESISDGKRAIRELIKTRRGALDGRWVEEAGAAAQERAVGLPEFGKARTVCCYLQMRGEPATGLIVSRARAMGKVVCVPVFDRESDRYVAARLNENAEIVRGMGGAPEPCAGPADRVSISDVDFIVVPGVAFDGMGGRVGRGGGHYDVMLAGAARVLFKLGLAFEFQVFDAVPAGPLDVRMDALATEKRTMRTSCPLG